MDVVYASVPYPPSIGGGQLYLHATAKHVARLGHRVRAVCQWSSTRSDWLYGSTVRCDRALEFTHEGISVNRLGFDRGTRRRMLPWVLAYRQKPLRGLAIRRISDLILPDVVAATGDPVDLIHVVRGGCEFLARAAFAHARDKGVPYVITPLHHHDWTADKYRHWAEIYRAADAVIAMTESEKRLLIERKGVAEQSVHVTGTGPILASEYSLRDFRESNGLSRRFVLFLGRKASYKGWRELLEAAPAIFRGDSNVDLVFVGRDDPKSLAAFANVDDPRIHNLGEVDLATKTAALAGCELLCVPSSSESFGAVYTEAWSFERPVIGGRTPPVAEVIDDGVDGLLTSVETGELAERIVWLLNHEEEARRMGRAGKAKVEQRFRWDRLAGKTVEVYKSLLPGVSSRTPNQPLV